MKEFEYSELLVSPASEYCLRNVAEFLSVWPVSACVFRCRSRENPDFASQLPQTSPPKSSTSPSKKGTSPPLRLGKTGGSPGVAAPPTLAFCRGLDGVLNQNTGFREKKVFPEGKKTLPLPAPFPAVAVFWGSV
ncbi:hypothetical protein BWD14_13810 [Leptospira santarosai]|uniref:Uncharacterized protein n=1 Tax=Leptospira santarosai TaxID=28183 RepID=A0AB73MXP5_9LEPT|nr:hypothetical protein BWD14_13810 [Leptospira santarosai]